MQMSYHLMHLSHQYAVVISGQSAKQGRGGTKGNVSATANGQSIRIPLWQSRRSRKPIRGMMEPGGSIPLVSCIREAKFLEETAGSSIVGVVPGKQCINGGVVEGIANDGLCRFQGISLAPVRRADVKA